MANLLQLLCLDSYFQEVSSLIAFIFYKRALGRVAGIQGYRLQGYFSLCSV